MDLDNVHSMALRRRMARQLGRSVSQAIWDLAVEDGHVGEALDPLYSPNGETELAAYLSKLLRISDGPMRARPRRARPSYSEPATTSPDLTARIEAISRLAADDAAGDAAIHHFRRHILGRDTPMSADEAEAFLASPTARGSPLVGRDGRHTVERLEYQNVHIHHSLAVWPDSPLDALRLLAAELAQSYPWEPAQAAAFVLEGLTPLVTPFLMHLPQVLRDGRPRRARLVMEVDMWMPASVVLRAYREVQRQVLPGHKRPVSRRSIDLVIFVVRHRPATWPELLVRWNQTHEDRPYADYRHMRFAFERARRSLLTPSYRLVTG